MTKRKIVFVGSFIERSKSGHIGGQLFACRSIVESSLKNNFAFIKLDTTADTNLSISFIKRLYQAIGRLFKYVGLILKRPDGVLIFSSAGMSFIEKGMMIILASPLIKKSVIAPRSGYLKDQIESSKIFRLYTKVVFSCATSIICQGESWKKFFLLHKLASESKLIVINNWIEDVPIINTQKNDLSIKILFVGWIDKNKGVYDLLETIKRVKNKNVKWILAGGGKDLEEVLKIKKNYQLDNLELAGWVMGDAKERLFREADIFILPSYREGMPNSLIEAMSYGLPTISTNVGGIPDIVEEGINGYLVEPGNIDQLCHFVETLVRDENKRKLFGNESIRLVKRNNSIDIAAGKIQSILES